MTRLDLTAEALRRLDIVTADPTGRRVGVLGLGIAGSAMARFLAHRGARVLGADERSDLDGAGLSDAGVELRLGPVEATTFDEVELLVISPGADPAQVGVQAVIDRGVPVCGELELVGHVPAKVAAITGTNGKSTTTALLGELVAATGTTTFVGGNLGDPLVAWIDRGDTADVAVIELSSYQLETAYRFAVDVAVVLNVTPDHFDRYPDVGSYADAKKRLIDNLDAGGIAVLNLDDERVRAMAEGCRGRVWWFSTRQSELQADGVALDGVTLDGDRLVPHGALHALGTVDLEHARLFGRHNRENALAAFVAAAALGFIDRRDGLLVGYRGFTGLEHRLELVGEVDGVRFINDTKATNDDAAAIAVQALDRPLILLAGGRGKGTGYDALVAAAVERVRLVVAFGEDRAAIVAAFAGRVELAEVETLHAAFDLAVERAVAGDAVLLAPACASFDEFENYAERGRAFKGWVSELEGRAS